MLVPVPDTALILVVEDDASIADAIRLRLVGEGFAVETASDGITAVAAWGPSILGWNLACASAP
jgi:CheY-like chemotaxis protein